MTITKAIKNQLLSIETTCDQYQSDVEQLLSETQDNFDNKSQKWQESKEGEKAQSIIDSLQVLQENLETARDSIQDVLDSAEVERD